jgi:hypothetical protein
VDDSDPEVGAALDAARAAFDSVRSRPDDPAKFQAISYLAEGFRRLWEETAAERPGIVRRIKDREKLAFAPLARRLSMSKTRAHQLYIEGGKDPEHV